MSTKKRISKIEEYATFYCCHCRAGLKVRCSDKPRVKVGTCPECGGRFRVSVPASTEAPLIRSGLDPVDIHSIIKHGGALDTGMTAGEAVRRASVWWATKGRKEILQTQHTGKAFASPNPESANFLESGIMRGLDWDLLNNREKLQIVKVWHHFAIRRPDKLGVDPEKPFRLDGKEQKLIQ